MLTARRVRRSGAWIQAALERWRLRQARARQGPTQRAAIRAPGWRGVRRGSGTVSVTVSGGAAEAGMIGAAVLKEGRGSAHGSGAQKGAGGRSATVGAGRSGSGGGVAAGALSAGTGAAVVAATVTAVTRPARVAGMNGRSGAAAAVMGAAGGRAGAGGEVAAVRAGTGTTETVAAGGAAAALVDAVDMIAPSGSAWRGCRAGGCIRVSSCVTGDWRRMALHSGVAAAFMPKPGHHVEAAVLSSGRSWGQRERISRVSRLGSAPHAMTALSVRRWVTRHDALSVGVVAMHIRKVACN